MWVLFFGTHCVTIERLVYNDKHNETGTMNEMVQSIYCLLKDCELLRI